MELVFPFRNYTINTLWDFFDKEKVKEFSDIKLGKEPWLEEHFNSYIEYWRNRLPNFENEILQIINTTDQKTIDEYFNSLRNKLYEVYECINEEYFISKIKEWNNTVLEKYTETVEKEGEEYAKQENRKRKHLEEYEDWEYDWFSFNTPNYNAKKIKKTNYNFYCIEKTADLIDLSITDEYVGLINSLYKELYSIASKYGKPWSEGIIKSKIEGHQTPKPILFVEGEHDITYILKAGKILGKESILDKIEIRQRGGFRNLDKLWNLLKEESWETNPQIKIFLYDCDTSKENEDFGNHYKRIIPTNPKSIINKGIENLLSNDILQKAISNKKAFIDFKKITGTKRGNEYEEISNEVNKDEKKNFCDWVCENCTKNDMELFIIVFDLIEEIIKQLPPTRV